MTEAENTRMSAGNPDAHPEPVQYPGAKAMSAAALRFVGGASASPTIPPDLILSAIPSLPRPILSRLTARMIDRMDELDGDPDLEPEFDDVDDDREPDDNGSSVAANWRPA